MNRHLYGRCMSAIEARWRSIGLYWSDAVADTISEVISEWEDGAGERAVNKWVWSSESRMDIAHLPRLYTEELPRQSFTVEAVGPGYARQRAGVKPYTLMREGFDAVWQVNHAGQPIPAHWEKTMRTIAERHVGDDKLRDLARIVADIDGGEGMDPPGYDPFA